MALINEKVAKETTPTSHLKINIIVKKRGEPISEVTKKTPSFVEAGFTLLEVMVVVGIMAAVITMVVPRLSNRNREIRSSIRKIVVMSKELHIRAKIANSTYRIAFDLSDGTNTGERPQSYWIEKSASKAPFKTPEALLKEREELEEESEDDDGEPGKPKVPKTPGGFTIDPSILKKKRKIPSGLLIRDIELASTDKEFTEGIVYIHYSPEGLTEEAAIHMQIDEKRQWTISIHPLTGKASVIGKDIALKEIQEQ